MKRKKLFLLAPTILLMSSVVGCKSEPNYIGIMGQLKDGTISKKVGDTINKSDIVVYGYTDKEDLTKRQEVSGWTCDQLFSSGDTYTFKESDITDPKKQNFIKVKYKSYEGNLALTVTQQTFTVKFVNNGKTETETVIKGNKVERPEGDFDTKDYIFDDWYVGDTKYDFDTPVTTDLTIEAKYVKFDEAAWKGAIDAIAEYDGNKNFELVQEHVDTVKYTETYKCNKNVTNYIHSSQVTQYYDYEDGINCYSLDQTTGNVNSILINNYPTTCNRSHLLQSCISFKIFAYDLYKNIQFNEETKDYFLEAEVKSPTTKYYKVASKFCVVDKKIYFKSINTLSKSTEEEQYSAECIYTFKNYGTTKLDKELSPTNVSTLAKTEAGTLSLKKTVTGSKKYYFSFTVPEDLSPVSSYYFVNFVVKNKNGDQIDISEFSGKESGKPEATGGIEVSSDIKLNDQSTGKNKIIQFNYGAKTTRFALECTLAGSEEIEDAEFIVKYATAKQ